MNEEEAQCTSVHLLCSMLISISKIQTLKETVCLQTNMPYFHRSLMHSFRAWNQSEGRVCVFVLAEKKAGCCNLQVQPGNSAGLKHNTLAEGNYTRMAIH